MRTSTKVVFAILGVAAACERSGASTGSASVAAPRTAPGTKEGHERMLALLRQVEAETPKGNRFLGTYPRDDLKAKLDALPKGGPPGPRCATLFQLAIEELRLGYPEEAIRIDTEATQLLASLGDSVPAEFTNQGQFELGMAYLRLGEVQNCCVRHNGESCILPIQGAGVHTSREGSEKAIACFTKVLDKVPADSPMGVKSKWLLNLAYMTLGEYPDGVPARDRIDPKVFASDEPFPRFANIAQQVGLDEFSPAGGMIAEDFDGDGVYELMVSTMHTSGQLRLYHLGEDGRYVDRTEAAGLAGEFGGLNLIDADYDNDGNVDVLVLRGAWWGAEGKHPRSLLRNRGDGTFVDVSFEAGIADARWPTQTAAWGDIDNDGDLDLYIGSESHPDFPCPCQLYRNEGNGTFTEIARQAGVTNDRYAKGVVFGDYDDDGYPDLYVSNMGAPNRLYHNNRDGTFTDVAEAAGVVQPHDGFATWFWDFDNDGKLDIWAGAYGGPGNAPDVANVAASYLGLPQKGELPHLYKGDGHGKFVDVAPVQGLTKHLLPMGVNFGDLDNDGYLDFYLATGYPQYEGLMPNVMYRNRGGKGFSDVTTAGGFGHLQKGHGVAFADLDGDGDQDVIVKMGGGYPGDAYGISLFENPGFGNHWIRLKLVGTRSNRSAIGAKIRVDVTENGKGRSIYRTVCTGGSFGCNPLEQEIGLGKAEKIDAIEIGWPTSRTHQTLRDVPVDQSIEITEGKDGSRPLAWKRIPFHH
jgi:hypothetical protein